MTSGRHRSREKRYWVGIDIGGTFTDYVLYDADKGEMFAYKIPTPGFHPRRDRAGGSPHRPRSPWRRGRGRGLRGPWDHRCHQCTADQGIAADRGPDNARVRRCAGNPAPNTARYVRLLRRLPASLGAENRRRRDNGAVGGHRGNRNAPRRGRGGRGNRIAGREGHSVARRLLHPQLRQFGSREGGW